jgi:hypothetical protein
VLEMSELGPWIWGAIGVVFTVLSGVGVHAFRLADRLSKAESKADDAAARVAVNEKDLTNLRIEVARDYVSNGKLDAMEKRVVEAISGLGARIDHAFAKGN